jgi:hypothetical protein
MFSASGQATPEGQPTRPNKKVDTGNNAKRAKRKNDRIVVIPPCVDRARRQQLEQNDIAWLMHYFAEETGEVGRYTYEFTGQQLEMAAAIARAIENGDDQAIAASRGEGKSTLAWRLTLKYVLQGRIKFPVLFAATGAAAANMLEEIKLELENNPRFHEDYPEVVFPILALEGVPQRAGTMLASGRRLDNDEIFEEVMIRFSWCGQQVYLPDMPGSPSRGAIFATRGLDAEVRGLRIKGRRVDLALIDDPDTEETARSEEQAEKLEKRIDRAIAGLGGQKKTVARIMLTTIQSTISVSAKFTDPQQKHSWKGKRMRMLVEPPADLDAWQNFITLWQQDQIEGTTKAHDLYAANRQRMDEGAIISNPHRHTEKQLSALEHYYTLVARYGQEAVDTEYNNDPPKPAETVDIGITPHRIQHQISGFARLIIPPGCTVLTQGIDCKKQSLHWVVRVWKPDGTGYTIAHGIHEVIGTKYGVEDGVEEAIRRAVIEHMEVFRNMEFRSPDGEIPIDPANWLTLIDTRYQGDAVKSACVEIGSSIMPVMGFGVSKGCVKGRQFHPAREATAEVKPGDHYNLRLTKMGKSKLWMVEADTDHWKRWEHARWMTGPDKPGRLHVFGESEEHGYRPRGRQNQDPNFQYAHHLCNEKEVDEPYKGQMRRVWKARAENVHWLDSSYYSDVAACIRGITIFKPIELARPAVRKPRVRVQNLNV